MTGVVPRNATACRAASLWAIAVICLVSSKVLRVHPYLWRVLPCPPLAMFLAKRASPPLLGAGSSRDRSLGEYSPPPKGEGSGEILVQGALAARVLPTSKS